MRQTVKGPCDAYAAMGFLGQYLLVFPEEKLVVVRMSRSTGAVPNEVLEMPEFLTLARDLVVERKAKPTSKKR